MDRLMLIVLGVVGASSLLLADFAVKGAVLLMLAGIAAGLLRRHSAATRHLVWVLALATLLAAPVLSALLPQWRVLPSWAGARVDARAAASGPTSGWPFVKPPRPGSTPGARAGTSPGRPIAATSSGVSEPRDGGSAPATPGAVGADAGERASWIRALPLVWATGLCVLALRLATARWMLRNASRRSTILGLRGGLTGATSDRIVRGVEAACAQLKIQPPVVHLTHAGEPIPMVWGLFRHHLLLPGAARAWSDEQLRSVLLHELAHIKRRDTAAQLLTQVACALHWFNPLVWVAAWRLGVERERACDDLVLASGVRPSLYARHLLDIVAALSPVRWAHACGLAMARTSSLEGRLMAVLNVHQNRRSISAGLAAATLVFAAALAVPVAMLRAANERPAERGSETGAPPLTGEKLQTSVEDNLQWGEPVNGLRAAVAIRAASDAAAGKPAAEGPPADGPAGASTPHGAPDLYLALQNVSAGPIRVSDANVPENVNLRKLHLRIGGEIKWGLGTRKPALGDVTLQPRQVVFLPIFDPAMKANVPTDPERTVGASIAGDAFEDARQRFSAEFEIDQAPAGAWTGKLVTGITSAASAAGRPQPKDEDAQTLFNAWQRHARGNGSLPGGLVGRLGDKMKEFIHANTGDASGDAYAKKMTPLLARIDATHDWSLEDVAKLMDDIAAVTPVPLDTMMDEMTLHTPRAGAPLPQELENAPWGPAQPDGLRLAWLLEPRADAYPMGTPLKARILVHNAGKETVVFHTRMWHQVAPTARDARGAQIKVDAITMLTIGQLAVFRLEPGQFVELHAPGVGVGPAGKPANWQNVAAWVEAKTGDEVTLSSGPVPMNNSNELPNDGEATWWPDMVKAVLAENLPLPSDPGERQRLASGAAMQLFGTPLAQEDIATFVSDHGAGALDALAGRLAKRTGVSVFTGELTSGPTTFRVLPPDAGAAKADLPARPAPPASARP